MLDPDVQAAIICEECNRPWLADERGWQAHLADLEEVLLYCLDCARREFGDD